MDEDDVMGCKNEMKPEKMNEMTTFWKIYAKSDYHIVYNNLIEMKRNKMN